MKSRNQTNQEIEGVMMKISNLEANVESKLLRRTRGYLITFRHDLATD